MASAKSTIEPHGQAFIWLSLAILSLSYFVHAPGSFAQEVVSDNTLGEETAPNEPPSEVGGAASKEPAQDVASFLDDEDSAPQVQSKALDVSEKANAVSNQLEPNGLSSVAPYNSLNGAVDEGSEFAPGGSSVTVPGALPEDSAGVGTVDGFGVEFNDDPNLFELHGDPYTGHPYGIDANRGDIRTREISLFGGTTPVSPHGRRSRNKLHAADTPVIAGLQFGDGRSFFRLARAVLRQDYWPSPSRHVTLRSNLWYIVAGPTFTSGVLELGVGVGAFSGRERRDLRQSELPFAQAAGRSDGVGDSENNPGTVNANHLGRETYHARSLGGVFHVHGNARLLQTQIGDLLVGGLYEFYGTVSTVGEFSPRRSRQTLPVIELAWTDRF